MTSAVTCTIDLMHEGAKDAPVECARCGLGPCATYDAATEAETRYRWARGELDKPARAPHGGRDPIDWIHEAGV